MVNTDPDHWFLPEAVMNPFRQPAFTSGNHATALVDGEAYMDHLAARLAATESGDFYHFTGWRFTPTAKLKPDECGSKTFLEILREMDERDVTIRCLAWIQSTMPGFNRDENVAFVTAVDALSNATAILDARLAEPALGSHHQKTSIVRSGGQDWAYVGGIDLALDRWDRPAHDSPKVACPPGGPEVPARQKELFEGWHDIHCVLQGPAVTHVWQNFKDRWNDTTEPHDEDDLPGDGVPPQITDPMPPVPALPPTLGPDHVQVLRTLACKDTYSFLPGGEQTVRLAYEKAIENAEHYVYIEDQYAWPNSLGPKLNQAAKRGVKIIFVLAHEYDSRPLRIVHNDMRHDDFLDTVREDAAQNVFVYHLQQTGGGADIYVHAKTMIVDDRYAAIGSTNINRRSHTTDSELQVAVVGGMPVSATIDGGAQMVRPFARNLRLRLWKEHLGLGASCTAVDDPVAGLTAWPSAGTTQVHHAVVHETPSFVLRSPLVTGAVAGAAVGGLLSWGDSAKAAVGGVVGAVAVYFLANAIMNRETDC